MVLENEKCLFDVFSVVVFGEMLWSFNCWVVLVLVFVIVISWLFSIINFEVWGLNIMLFFLLRIYLFIVIFVKFWGLGVIIMFFGLL